MGSLLWFIAIVLLVLWALGAFVVNFGGLVHILIVAVLVLIIFNLVRGRRAAR